VVLWTVVSVALTVVGIWRIARARRADSAAWTTQPS
jgi:hypothetical protein